MRVKTESRRQAIIATAWDVFRENGFERSSMAQVAERLGGSKGTLYNYFKSKEELFAAAVEEALRERAEGLFQQVVGKGGIRGRLLKFGRTYMEAVLADDLISLHRSLIAEGARSEIGEVLLKRLILSQWAMLGGVLEQEMAAGRLRVGSGYNAAIHFRGLIEADLVERRLHGDRSITPQQVDAAVKDGVAAFMRAYSARERGRHETELS